MSLIQEALSRIKAFLLVGGTKVNTTFLPDNDFPEFTKTTPGGIDTFNLTDGIITESKLHQDVIDQLGGGGIGNVTANDIEITDYTKGFIQYDVNGVKYRVTIGTSGERVVTNINTTPATPTGPTTDDNADTYNWTNTPGFAAVSDYEYTINAGSSYAAVTVKPVVIGDVAKATSQVGVRVKAALGRNASATLYNTVAFTVASGSFDTDAQDYFTRHAAAGDTLTTNEKIAINAWFVAMKSVNGTNEYAKIKELYLLAGTSLTGARVKAKLVVSGSLPITNLVSGDYTHDGGIRGNTNPGSGKVINTGIVVFDDLSISNFNHHLVVAFDGQHRDHALGGGGVYNMGVYHCITAPTAYDSEMRIGGNSDSPISFPAERKWANAGIIMVNAPTQSTGKFLLDGRLMNNYSGGNRVEFNGSKTIGLLSNGDGNSPASIWLFCVGTAFLDANLPAINTLYRTLLSALGRKYANFVFEGDSMTFGSGPTGGQSYINQFIKKLDLPYYHDNLGISGQRVSAMLTNSTTKYTPLYKSNSVFSIFAGINDVFDNRSAAAIYADILGCVNNAKAIGYSNFMVGTVTPTTIYTGSQETIRGSLNTLIRNGAASNGYAVVDFAADTSIGTHNGTDYVDEIHWTNVGAGKAADVAKAAYLAAGFVI